MPVAIRVSVDASDAINMLDNYIVQFPRQMGEAMHDISRDMAMELKSEVTRQNLIWRGKLFNGIESRKKSENRSEVFIPIHGVYLDRMRPHYVSLKRGRLITQWARTSPKSPYQGRKPKDLPGGIFVRPHPWIDNALSRSINKVPDKIRRRLQIVHERAQ